MAREVVYTKFACTICPKSKPSMDMAELIAHVEREHGHPRTEAITLAVRMPILNLPQVGVAQIVTGKPLRIRTPEALAKKKARRSARRDARRDKRQKERESTSVL